MIPYGRHQLDEADRQAVLEVLNGDWITQGPTVSRFENAIAEQVGARFAVAFANGTGALHGACAAAGVGPGDLVATSALSFAASANCARYVGADVALVDIDANTLNVDLDLVPPCDALVAVHFAGRPLDLAGLKERPRVVIEDAAHALGAMTPDGPIGNCAHSDMAVFSFHPVKAITTGEGGMVTTNDADLSDRLRLFRSHGMVAKPEMAGWYYEIESEGFNYRLTDLQAALGLSQLQKLGDFIERRNYLADRYRELLADLPVRLPPVVAPGWLHAFHLFPVRVPDRHRVYDYMRDQGIGVQVHYVPVHFHPRFAKSAGANALNHTNHAYSELLSLPMFPGLTDEDQSRTCQVLEDALG